MFKGPWLALSHIGIVLVAMFPELSGQLTSQLTTWSEWCIVEEISPQKAKEKESYTKWSFWEEIVVLV